MKTLDTTPDLTLSAIFVTQTLPNNAITCGWIIGNIQHASDLIAAMYNSLEEEMLEKKFKYSMFDAKDIEAIKKQVILKLMEQKKKGIV